MSEQKDFFISYTRADRRWAEWIAWQLEAARYTTVIQAWDFRPGGNFVLDMHEATKQAQRTIAVLSPDYFASKFTASEWAEAFRQDPTGEQGLLLPVRVRPCDVEGLFGARSYIDLVDKHEDAAKEALLNGIQFQRQKPPNPPPFPPILAQAPSQPPSFPGTLPAIWNVPYHRNRYFTGREDLLRQLAQALRGGQTMALSQPQAISGLGGVGKTQTALEYAYRYYQDYDAVLWCHADIREALITDFVALAQLLKLPQQAEKDQMVIVQAVKDWLRTHERWLLILDNADNLSIIHDFLPTMSKGHILLTTRAASTGSIANRIEIDTLDLATGTIFVLRRARLLAPGATLDQTAPDMREQAEKLVQAMGGLPLALDQAGAYIEEVQCSLQEYRQRYQAYRSALLKQRGDIISDHPEPVATTWSLSFEKVEQTSPVAADILRVCAFLQPEVIPEELFREGASQLGPSLVAVADNDLLFDQALHALRAYSLIRRDPQEHLLTVHRLVQAVLIDAMDADTQRLWAERTIAALDAILPEVDHRTRTRYKRCLTHALGCVPLIDQLQLTTTATTNLLHQTALYLYEYALYTEAEPLYLRSLHIREQTLGLYHPDVAYPLNDLAALYYSQGKYAKAESLCQRALHIREQTFGPDHPQVAYPLTNLALLYYEQGKYAEAEPLYLRALRIREQALGPDHPQVAYPLTNLALLYYEQGKYAEAEPLYQRALHIREQTLGPDHPDVAYPLTNLAILYYKQGKYAEAESLYLRALRIREQALGPDHPQVAYPLTNLALLYYEQGKYAEAESLYLRALRIREQALGPDHPQVAYPLNGLALLYYEQGKYTEAEPLYQRALHIREQVFPEHPRTRGTATSYAKLLRKLGRENEAQQIEKRHSVGK